MANGSPPLLPLQDLSERHHAFTWSLANCYLEAARVCLDRHHSSPKDFRLSDDQVEAIARVEWESTDARTKGAWANLDDATRDGAYAVAIAAVELLRNKFAVRRAETRTGVDYYIAPADQDPADLENWLRLEVSGTHSERSEVKRRLRIKAEQAKQGNSNLPAVAAVVGFRVGLVVLQTIQEDS